MRQLSYFFWMVLFVLLSGVSGCENDPLAPKYNTKHTIIIVVDGPRWSETWGNPQHTFIPYRDTSIRPHSRFFSFCYNDGETVTNSGHTAITTGVYESLENSGQELPTLPGIFHYYRKFTGALPEKTWVVASKDKLNILAGSKDTTVMQYAPRYDCGVNGPGSGYRDDTITCRLALNVLRTHQPDLMLINFKEPDASGHTGVWPLYISGVRSSDSLVHVIWNYVRNSPYYKHNTTIIITNDHGRHTDGNQDGFRSHGDNCEGCKHIELLIAGPDVTPGVEQKRVSQNDIARTVATLMGFRMPTGHGKFLPLR